jgi:hypothetical protein
MKNDIFYSSRRSIVTTMISLEKDAKWKVTLKMEQGRKNEDSPWEKRDTEITLFGNDIDETEAQAAITFNQYMESIGWDLFSLSEEKKVLND